MTGTTAYFCAVALLADALLLRLSIVDGRRMVCRLPARRRVPVAAVKR